MSANPSIFRKQVAEKKRLRVSGDVLVVPNKLISILSLSSILLCSTMLIVISFTTYSKHNTAIGWVTPESDFIEIYANEKNRLISEILVTDNQFIEKGDPLFTVESFDSTSRNRDTLELLKSNILKRIQAANNRLKQVDLISKKEINLLISERELARNKVTSLKENLELAQEKVELNSNSFQKLSNLYQKNMISSTELDLANTNYLEAKRDLINISESISDFKNQINDTKVRIELKKEQLKYEKQNIISELSMLEDELIQLESEETNTIKAPISGYISYLNPSLGTSPNVGSKLVSISSKKNKLIGKIALAPSDISDIKVGDKIKISYDSLPQEHYGVFDATVKSISSSSTQAQALDSPRQLTPNAYYIVYADLSDHIEKVKNTSVDGAILPGMLFQARLITEEKTIFEWLIDPIRNYQL